MSEFHIDPGVPPPVPDEASEPFFTAAAHGELLMQNCEHCGAWMVPVKPMCVECMSTHVSWSQASGQGTLYSWTVVHQAFHPAFRELVPYQLGTVELEEGPRIVTSIGGIERPTVGMPVRVAFDVLSNGTAVPRFQAV
jgi:uncharacterized OB-fold protein